jgi:hypothetical protein
MWNTALRNSGYGVYFSTYSSNNQLYLNRFGFNQISNALDDGTSNMWDDGFLSGNWWSDYNETGTYEITGEAQSVDHHPFSWDETPESRDTQIITTIALVTIVVVALVVIALVLKRRRA